MDIVSISNELVAQDPEFAAVIRKWAPKANAIAKKMAYLQKIPVDDAYQEVAGFMWEACTAWRMPQVRYKKGLWEVIAEHAGVLWIRCAHNGEEDIIDTCEAEAVKKASLSSFVYLKLIQRYSNSLKVHFTAKNGYTVNAEDPTRHDSTHFDVSLEQLLGAGVDIAQHEASCGASLPVMQQIWKKLDVSARQVWEMKLASDFEVKLRKSSMDEVQFLAASLQMKASRVKSTLATIKQLVQEELCD
jgi:hypothetical protein